MIRLLTIFYPLFFLLASIFSYYGNNQDKYNFSATYRLIIFTTLAYFLVFFLVSLVVRNVNKSSLICFLLSVFYLFFNKFNATLEKAISIKNSFIIDKLVTLIALVISIVILYYLYKYLVNRRATCNKFILSTSIFLLFIILLNIFLSKKSEKNVTNDSSGEDYLINPIELNTIKSYKGTPDIFYIIFDGYPRKDVCKDIFGFDNDDIYSFFKEKEFMVFEDSLCNYSSTINSLNSSLNSSYLNTKVSLNKSIVSIQHGIPKIVSLLKSIGYKYITFDSDYYATTSKLSDINFSLKFINYFERTYLNTTLSNYVLRMFKNSFTDNRVKIIDNAYKKLMSLERSENPKFVFAHLILPHPPFNFDEYGNVKQDAIDDNYGYGKYNINNKEQKKYFISRYVEQIKYTNKLIKNIINKLSDESSPIIIIQSDHGSMTNVNVKKNTELSIYERLPILNAISKNKLLKLDQWPNDLTPVNTFRYLLNNLFNTELKILENKSYFYDFYDKPYTNQEIKK